jgi:CHAT domain-containing protein
VVSPIRTVLPLRGARAAVSALALLYFATISCALAALPAQSAATNSAQGKSFAVRLEAGKPLDKMLAGGEKDSYDIYVGSGQFLHAVVEQLGLDVALTLYAPDGKLIASMDSPNGNHGLEQLSTIAETPGIYRLDITAPDKTVPSGRYRVAVDPIHEPDDKARARISAERAFYRATVLFEEQGMLSNSLRSASEKYVATLPLWQAAGDMYEEALTRGLVGLISLSIGENQKALDYLHQALALSQAVGDPYEQDAILGFLGGAHNNLFEFKEAIDSYSRALSLERSKADRFAESETLNNIGATYEVLGEQQKALDYFNQALTLKRSMGDRYVHTILNNIGVMYIGLGDTKNGLDYYKQALELARALEDRTKEADILGNIGATYDRLGQRDKALDYFNQELSLSRSLGNRYGEADALRLLGNFYSSSFFGDKQTAVEYYNQALALFWPEHPGDQIMVMNGLMRVWRDLKQPETAIFFGKQAVNAIQKIRTNIKGLEILDQQAFLHSNENVYRELADLLITQGRLLEAQQVLDLLKTEEYFSFIRRDANESSSLTAPVNLTRSEDAVNREYDERASRIAAIGREWAALHAKPSRTPEEEKHLAELTLQLKTASEAWERFLSGLYAELGKTNEADKTVENIRESTTGMQRVLHELGPGVVALYTLVGDEKYRIIIVTSTVMIAREYPIKAQDLRKKVFEFRQSLVDPKSDPVPKAQALYQILVAPARGDLASANAETLMWSLDDVLRYIPMTALHDGHQYLVEKYNNEVFTPASVASLTERPNVSGWRGLGMGVSKSYGDFSALPSVPEELNRIIRDKNVPGASGVLPGETMLDEAFTEDGMKKALEGNFPIIHIASHFASAPGNETDSFLLLGGKDPQGEHLSLSELRKDPGFSFTDTELLTLSACDTAVSGAAGDGREVDGLGVLAQQKGARAVVASLWGVDDQSTGILMQEFYKLWTASQGVTKGEALREAQLELLRGTVATDDLSHPVYAHPFYWAPFILIGNWR